MPDKHPDRVERSEPDSKTFKSMRERQGAEHRGTPLNNDSPLHPSRRVEDANAYKRADGTRHTKDS